MLTSIFLTALISNIIFVKSATIYVNSTTPLAIVSDKFLGVTLDPWVTHNPQWDGLNFSYIVPLARALGPSIIRFGGTYADETIFVVKPFNGSTYNEFTAEKLDLLWNFANNSGWRLIFDLNQLLRSGSNWNSTNAQELLNYATSKGYSMDFELGNEPDDYRWFFKTNLTGKQIADGYRDLRNLLNSNAMYKDSMIIGPSVAHAYNLWILQDFLSNGGGNYINYLTFHHYYFNGNGTTGKDYMNSTIMDSLLDSLRDIKSLNYTPIWLSETAIDFCSCAANRSNTFIAGFLWLDKLGLSALYGIDNVLRMDLYLGYFALIDNSLGPRPDYWLSLVYKKLVGNKVYGVSSDVSNQTLRVYAASSKNTDGIVVYGISLLNKPYTLDFPQLSNKQATAYFFTEGEAGNLLSLDSRLNGHLLKWTTHEPLTNMKGNVTTLPIKVPGNSQFFIVLNQTTAQQCPQGWHKESTVSNKCIKYVNNYNMPWFAVNFDCTTYSINSSLISIQNAFENAEIAGLASSADCNEFYTGLYRNGSSWSWVNGNSGTYRNWKSGFPSNETTQNCVVFDAKTGSWSNKDCDNSYCYICQQYI